MISTLFTSGIYPQKPWLYLWNIYVNTNPISPYLNPIPFSSLEGLTALPNNICYSVKWTVINCNFLQQGYHSQDGWSYLDMALGGFENKICKLLNLLASYLLRYSLTQIDFYRRHLIKLQFFFFLNMFPFQFNHI